MKLANCSLKQYRDLGENMTGDQKCYRIPAMVDVYQNILEQTLHVDDILLSLKVFIGKVFNDLEFLLHTCLHKLLI